MSTDIPTNPTFGALGPSESDTDPAVHAHLARLAETLEHELVETQEQLNLVCAITGRMGTLRDNEHVQTTLLNDLAEMVGADVLMVDSGGCCRRLLPAESSGVSASTALYSSDAVRGALGTQIEAVRLGRRATVVQEVVRLDRARALLAPLGASDRECSIVLALRSHAKPPFNLSSVMAVEAVLGFGSEVMQNLAMARHLHRSTLETVYVLVNAIDAKDNYTSAHSERVGALARLIGERMTLSRESIQTLEWAGLLHDVGKIGVPEQVLNKPGALTETEMGQMREHSRLGHDILRPVTQFEPFLNAVLYHHENHDGSGYPEGLAGSAIPLEARIVHVVDIFDALTTRRPYRPAFDAKRAIGVIVDGSGRITDPDVTRAFIETIQTCDLSDRDSLQPRFDHLLTPAASRC